MQLEDIMSDIKRTASKVRSRLKHMEQEIDKLEVLKTMSAELRIKKVRLLPLQHFEL